MVSGKGGLAGGVYCSCSVPGLPPFPTKKKFHLAPLKHVF